MTVAEMTKDELLKLAKNLNIKGRHDMPKVELAKAVAEAQSGRSLDTEPSDDVDGVDILEDDQDEGEEGDEEEVDEDEGEDEDLGDEMEAAAELPPLDPAMVLDVKRRYPSDAKRDPVSRKVIRKGVRFNNNIPFQHKYYFVHPRVAQLSQNPELAKSESDKVTVEALKAAPPQVRAIVTAMAKGGMTTAQDSGTGGEIVDQAKALNLITSKIESRMLFAYYRRVLERVGVIHAGDFEE